MRSRVNLFEDVGDVPETAPNFPAGLRYLKELISEADERELLAHLRELPFRDFEFHGYTGKRRVISFGWHYDFTGRRLRKADDIPDYLLSLRERAAEFAATKPAEFAHALVIEYGPGAGIGWHRDKAVFGEVVGISLLSPCALRFRRALAGRKWERMNLLAEPRSAYHLSGPARYEWEHSILRVDSLRYSVTFRNLLDG
ncbi:MAG TPA: alpha-ketoglutarate-dependent dioxygenase AlkB [Pyrinomonadaceae bacterium]|jgi:alkylated DNA repair dioxygenase AlkB